MNELHRQPEITDIKKPDVENFKAIKPESDITVKDARSYFDGLFEEMQEQKDGFYTDYDNRMKRTNMDTDGWEDKRGESKFTPSSETETGLAAKEKLAEYGKDGIEYMKCEPDFSQCAEATVNIDNMTENRVNYIDADGKLQQGNFSQADIKCAEIWSESEKDGKSDWTPRDVQEWRQEKGFTWHERCDTLTMDLVPQEIHGYFQHSGGVAECKARDNSIGGGFDEQV